MEDAKSDAWLEWVNYHLFPLRIASSWAHGGLGGGSCVGGLKVRIMGEGQEMWGIGHSEEGMGPQCARYGAHRFLVAVCGRLRATQPAEKASRDPPGDGRGVR